MTQVVVVGGGTAGWMTALLVQKRYPSKTVTLIESTEIGILGAGEGTTPHFFDFLREADIPVQSLVQRCAATFKTGIVFENWGCGKQQYIHSFLTHPDLYGLDDQWAHIRSAVVSSGKNLDSVTFNNHCVEQHRLPVIYTSYPEAVSTTQAYSELGLLGLHFNARLLAQELKRIAISRGVVFVDGRVTGFAQNEAGDVVGIKLGDTVVKSDFVFDCTGFARLIIGKLYQTKWDSYDAFLPMKKAIPFFMGHDNDVAPCTRAVAMKYGWLWQIPVQGRYGMGYVFDSDYISADEALAEVQEIYGDVVSPTEFKFSAGCFAKTCVNNVAAVGLAQGFVEPLEATSLWVSYATVKDVLDSGLVDEFTADKQAQVNQNFKQRTDEIADFLYAHYLTDRDDSPFWREFRIKNAPSPRLQEKLDRIAEDPSSADSSLTFGAYSWVPVLAGVRHPVRVPVGPRAKLHVTETMFVQNQLRMLGHCLPHVQVLKDFGAAV